MVLPHATAEVVSVQAPASLISPKPNRSGSSEDAVDQSTMESSQAGDKPATKPASRFRSSTSSRTAVDSAAEKASDQTSEARKLSSDGSETEKLGSITGMKQGRAQLQEFQRNGSALVVSKPQVLGPVPPNTNEGAEGTPATEAEGPSPKLTIETEEAFSSSGANRRSALRSRSPEGRGGGEEVKSLRASIGSEGRKSVRVDSHSQRSSIRSGNASPEAGAFFISPEEALRDLNKTRQQPPNLNLRTASETEQAARLASMLNHEQEHASSYPFKGATTIHQTDIEDEGLPPDQRAGPAREHVDLVVNLKGCSNLPKMDVAGRCDCYCVLSFDNQQFKTEIVYNSFDCTWNCVCRIFVHEVQVQHAKEADPKTGSGLVLKAELFDWDRFSQHDRIGEVLYDLCQMISLPSDGQDFKTLVFDKSGNNVIGHSGEPTELHLSIKIEPRTSDWKPSTVQQMLAGSHTADDFERSNSNELDPIDISQSRMAPNTPELHVKRERRASNLPPQAFHGEITATGFNDSPDMFGNEALEDDGDNTIDQYWRETLEHVMDSLTVNIIVCILIFVDIINIIVFEFVNPPEEGEQEPAQQVALTITVITLFVIELTLRQIAQGRRFWWNYWNVFDFFVIWGSVFITIAKYSITADESGAVGGAKNVASVLRILSRVAMGLRIARILSNLRKAQALSGAVGRKLRTTVSANKRRYIKHGFDLDLTYITNRVVAMSAPAFGGHTAYRNDIHVVSRFFSLKHYGNFFVFNLCDTYHSSDGVMGNYHPQMLFNRVQRIPFEDHAPPLFSELLYFCVEASHWLQQDPKNVFAVHCKGGKGRTGVAIAAFLLWSGHRRCALDALELFVFRRTQDYDPKAGLDEANDDEETQKVKRRPNQGVEGPSQKRYVHYLEAVLYNKIDPWTEKKMVINSLTFNPGEKVKIDEQFLSFTVTCQRIKVFDSLTSEKKPRAVKPGQGEVSFDVNETVWSDIRIDFFKHKSASAESRSLYFFTICHTTFYDEGEPIVFNKRNIDMLHKDPKHKRVGKDARLTVNIASKASHEMRAEQKVHAIFEKFGHEQKFIRGETIVQEHDHSRNVMLVTSGCVEYAVHDQHNDGQESHHPLGSLVPVRHAEPMRVPIISIHGAGTVLGTSNFLIATDGVSVRAKEDTTVLIIGHDVVDTLLDSPRRAQQHELREDLHDLPELTTKDMADFYEGLAVKLAVPLARVLNESVRIGGLAALNDRQSVLQDADNRISVRKSAISVFGLPVNEHLVLSQKCACKPPKAPDSKRMRLVVLRDHVILDSAIYGPAINPTGSDIFRLDQLKSVSIKDTFHPSTLVLTLEKQEENESTHISISYDSNYELTFTSVYRAQQVLRVLMFFCTRAEKARSRQSSENFETPDITDFLTSISTIHTLESSDKLPSSSRADSLFIIRTGGIRVRRDGKVTRLLRTGGAFGMPDFIHGFRSDSYSIEAGEKTRLLEVRRSDIVAKWKGAGMDEMRAKFFKFVAQLMQHDMIDALKEAFPGTWSQHILLTSEDLQDRPRSSMSSKSGTPIGRRKSAPKSSPAAGQTRMFGASLKDLGLGRAMSSASPLARQASKRWGGKTPTGGSARNSNSDILVPENLHSLTPSSQNSFSGTSGDLRKMASFSGRR